MMDPGSLALLVGLLANAAAVAFVGLRSSRGLTEIKLNVEKIELATNSMKDALVKATGEAAHAAGLKEGQDAGEEKAATLLEGQTQGRSQERSSVAASVPSALAAASSSPVAVADERVAGAAERSADALERTATATEETTTEEKKKVKREVLIDERKKR